MNYSMWTLDKEKPVYIQLVNNIKYEILSGRILPGEFLPSIRDMAKLTQTNPNTVGRACRELRKQKFLVSNRTNRFSVTEDIEHITLMREKSVDENCCTFLSSMLSFGFDKAEILAYLNHISESL